MLPFLPKLCLMTFTNNRVLHCLLYEVWGEREVCMSQTRLMFQARQSIILCDLWILTLKSLVLTQLHLQLVALMSQLVPRKTMLLLWCHKHNHNKKIDKPRQGSWHASCTKTFKYSLFIFITTWWFYFSFFLVKPDIRLHSNELIGV